MSEYADIKIRNLSLYSFRNYLQDDIVYFLFSKKDYVCIPNYNDDPEDEDSEIYTKYMYKTTVQRAKERLDALGYSVSKFEDVFNKERHNAIYYDAFLAKLHVDYDEYEEKARVRVNKYVTFKKWKNSVDKIIKHELADGNINPYDSKSAESIGITTECDKIIYYSLKRIDQSSYYGLKTEIIKIAFTIRLILESCEPADEIILDFTNLGYWSDDSISQALLATENDEKIIVLVEGTSDKDILEFAMSKIYPHLCDLFYFMDFEDGFGGKRDGGTSFMIKNLKAFYFAKFKTKFIAIFDNDAEGYQSKCTLENEIKTWPDNFRFFLYPEDDLFKSYPTILPNESISNDNINKKACSIELYLPDILIQENDKFIPIEWETRKNVKHVGNEERLYQGVICQKEKIKDKYISMKNRIESGKQYFIESDWLRIKKILNTIVFAFK